MAEIRRLRGLPVEAPRVQTVVDPTRSEGDVFAAMTEAEQRAFIRLWTLTVYRKDSEHQNALVAALRGRRWTLSRRS